ncbi:MAG: M20/M25/M40 family metallo-hydrolase, partial [Planctomycetota bacterium]
MKDLRFLPPGSRVRRHLLVYSLVFGLALGVAGSGRASEPLDDSPDPLEIITAADAKKRLTVLASDAMEGRRAGTPGAYKAAEYIAASFREAGIAPGGKDGTYFQPLKVRPASMPGKDNRLHVIGVEKTFKMKPLEDFVPFAFSPVAEAEGPVVFAGYGISAPEEDWDDCAGIDVKGKIVLVLRNGPKGKFEERGAGRRRMFGRSGRGGKLAFHTKAKTAQEHGAAGLIVVTDPAHFRRGDRLAFLAGGGSGIRIPCVHASQIVGEALLRLVGDTLKKRQDKMDKEGKTLSEAIPTVRIELATSILRGRGTCRNVVGLLKGADPVLSKECIVIGAHYDHLGYGDIGARANFPPGDVFNGADDNASGVVGVIEVARAFGALPIRPKRSVVFVAFTGEEVGLFGSRFYAENPLFP